MAATDTKAQLAASLTKAQLIGLVTKCVQKQVGESLDEAVRSMGMRAACIRSIAACQAGHGALPHPLDSALALALFCKQGVVRWRAERYAQLQVR